ncbi:hypothetical protein IWZ03DRAFT_135274 [Phyllosticta citriasiana]|uniref:Uncharacterized protein n=1 Tax=Phyllosticta citriasiana TaxID=595635 RepID=A0ABR1KWM3_9PEZI
MHVALLRGCAFGFGMFPVLPVGAAARPWPSWWLQAPVLAESILFFFFFFFPTLLLISWLGKRGGMQDESSPPDPCLAWAPTHQWRARRTKQQHAACFGGLAFGRLGSIIRAPVGSPIPRRPCPCLLFSAHASPGMGMAVRKRPSPAVAGPKGARARHPSLSLFLSLPRSQTLAPAIFQPGNGNHQKKKKKFSTTRI